MSVYSYLSVVSMGSQGVEDTECSKHDVLTSRPCGHGRQDLEVCLAADRPEDSRWPPRSSIRRGSTVADRRRTSPAFNRSGSGRAG